MPRAPKKGPKAGANPHQLFLLAYTRRIVDDPQFRKARTAIYSSQSFPSRTRGDVLFAWYQVLRTEAQPGSPGANTLAAATEIARRYFLERVEGADWLAFQMIVTGKVPDLSQVFTGAVLWQPVVRIPQGGAFEDVASQLRDLLLRDWTKMKERSNWVDREWAERLPAKDMEQYAEWFYWIRVRKRSTTSLAMDSGPGERTIQRGVEVAEALLGLRPPPREKARQKFAGRTDASRDH